MKKITVVALFAALSLGSQLAAPQTRSTKPPDPPPRLGPDPTAPDATQAATPALRMNLAQVREEAAELARTAQSIPNDVESVRKGMLPKDTITKLKQIEKLSKHLRSELNP